MVKLEAHFYSNYLRLLLCFNLVWKDLGSRDFVVAVVVILGSVRDTQSSSLDYTPCNLTTNLAHPSSQLLFQLFSIAASHSPTMQSPSAAISTIGITFLNGGGGEQRNGQVNDMILTILPAATLS